MGLGGIYRKVVFDISVLLLFIMFGIFFLEIFFLFGDLIFVLYVSVLYILARFIYIFIFYMIVIAQQKPGMIGLRASDNSCSKVNRRWLDIQIVWTITDNTQMKLRLWIYRFGVDRGSGEIVQIGLCQVSMLHNSINALVFLRRPITAA